MKAVWTKKTYQQFLEQLNSNREEDYRKFQQKFITTSFPILGVRIPCLRKLAKEIGKTDIKSFLSFVTRSSFEEIIVEGLVIGLVTEKDEFLSYFNSFLSVVDNWATCDICCSSFSVIKKEKAYFYDRVKQLALSSKEFEARVGVVLLMDYYLDDHLEDVLTLLDQIKNEHYYVQMAMAWLLSVALVRDYSKTLLYLKEDHLSNFVHNKAIQKARESFRISKEQKDELILLKRNKKR